MTLRVVLEGLAAERGCAVVLLTAAGRGGGESGGRREDRSEPRDYDRGFVTGLRKLLMCRIIRSRMGVVC